MIGRRLLPMIAVICLQLARPVARAQAQVAIDANTRRVVAAGFDVERYLRAMQVAGLAPLRPWSIRAFGPAELEKLVPAESAAHPWSSRTRTDQRGLQIWLLAPEMGATFNTTMPYGYNDGALWAGRGLTSNVQFGFGARAGPLSLVVAPQAFRAENRPFTLQANGATGPLAFGDAYNPYFIDHPQRFGDGPYQRLDLGQSTLRLDLGPAAIGASTANEYWGPAVAEPILLGNNAPGFPHLFAGTSKPLDLWFMTVHARALWGRLDQSAYSPSQPPYLVTETNETRRFAAGLIGVITLRGAPGLELGAARFYHETWPLGGPRRGDFLLPFTLHNFNAARANIAEKTFDNQLASLFARWVFPDAHLELYGEFGRDDYNADLADVIAEPDHESAYTIGATRTWRVGKDRLVVLNGELLNSRVSHLAKVRGESPFYIHNTLVQGHTELGQILGAPAGLGGGATDLSLDVYSPGGRWTVGYTRHLVDDSRPGTADVISAFSVERVWFGRHLDLYAGLTPSLELNRRPGQDVGNVSAHVGAVAHW